jgi:hypothetical protein
MQKHDGRSDIKNGKQRSSEASHDLQTKDSLAVHLFSTM